MDAVQDLPYVAGPPANRALIRASPEDFQVIEELPFAPSGEGGHVWLLLCKRDANTVWLAHRLARIAGVRSVDVGYAGLKDRHALTTRAWRDGKLAWGGSQGPPCADYPVVQC